MVGHKLVSFAAVIALWTLEILPIKLTRILLMWKYIQEKHYAIFAAVSKAELFCLRNFLSGYSGWRFQTRKFSSGRFPLDLGPGFSYEHITFLRVEERRGEISEASQPGRPGLYKEALNFLSK